MADYALKVKTRRILVKRGWELKNNEIFNGKITVKFNAKNKDDLHRQILRYLGYDVLL